MLSRSQTLVSILTVILLSKVDRQISNKFGTDTLGKLSYQLSPTKFHPRFWASRWKTLQQENAPLRAVLNGQLASVPEDIYDPWVEREIAAETGEFWEARVIGNVLGKYQLGIGDAWIALRIEEMLRAGKLQAVTEPAPDRPIYHRKLRRCD